MSGDRCAASSSSRRQGQRFPQADGRRRGVGGAEDAADAGDAARAGLQAAEGVGLVDAAEGEHRDGGGAAGVGEGGVAAPALAGSVIHGREDGEVGAFAGSPGDRLRGVDADADDAETEGARVPRREASCGKVHAVGAGGQRDVGAVVHQQWRRERIADPAQDARLVEKLP